MRGSGLTRYRPEFPSSQGGGSLRRFLGNALNDIKKPTKKSALREGWKSFKSGGPLGLPSVFAGVQERSHPRCQTRCQEKSQFGHQPCQCRGQEGGP